MLGALREKLTKGDTPLLTRSVGSYGRIHAEEVQREIKFEVPGHQLAVVAKRDAAQHPFLEPLFQWGKAVRYFEFGKGLGHMNLGIPVKELVFPLNEKDTTQVLPVFDKGLRSLGTPFKEAIMADMASLGYPIEDITLRKSPRIQLLAPVPLDVVGVAVKESDLACYTDQINMSAGMFRALSVIVQVNYLTMSGVGTCILVDDVGEGLDFDRSCKLIELLRSKSKQSAVQLIMSTNDRFVMNKVPLEEWCYLIRNGHRVRVLNYHNAREEFERFKRTGLNNFDLLATNYLEQLTTNGQARNIR